MQAGRDGGEIRAKTATEKEGNKVNGGSFRNTVEGGKKGIFTAQRAASVQLSSCSKCEVRAGTVWEKRNKLDLTANGCVTTV